MIGLTVSLCRLTGVDVPLPSYQTLGSAGMDLPAAVLEPVTLAPGERRLIPCGFAIALPDGYEAQIRPRSGLAHRFGVTVLNAPGTIDADYRGEVCVLLVNHGSDRSSSSVATGSPSSSSRPLRGSPGVLSKRCLGRPGAAAGSATRVGVETARE